MTMKSDLGLAHQCFFNTGSTGITASGVSISNTFPVSMLKHQNNYLHCFYLQH